MLMSVLEAGIPPFFFFFAFLLVQKQGCDKSEESRRGAAIWTAHLFLHIIDLYLSYGLVMVIMLLNFI